MIENYRAEVVKNFAEIFAADTGRFIDGDRLLLRFNEAVHRALAGSR